jgi:CHAT domain-containing protein/tetratricopeptide (TPR) repeat protein
MRLVSHPTVIALSTLLLCTTQIFHDKALGYTNLLAQTQPSAKRQSEIDRLLAQGDDFYTKEDYQAALVQYRQAFELSQQINDSERIGQSLNEIGLVYYQLNQYAEALAAYQHALSILETINVPDKRATILNRIGLIYDAWGNYYKALEAYQNALSAFEQTHNILGQSRVHHNAGLAYYHLGDYAKALSEYQQALTLRQQTDDREGEAFILTRIGTIYTDLGQYVEALNVYQQALVILDNTENQTLRAQTLASIGLNYSRQGEFEQALQFYQQALSIYQQKGERSRISLTLNNLAEAHRKLGQNAEALDALKQALAIAQAIGDRRVEGAILDSLGNVYKDSGQDTDALAAYQQSLAIGRTIRDRSGEATTLANLGKLFKQQNRPSIAIAFYKQSVNVTESIRQDLQSLPREQQESYTKTIADTYRNLSDLLLAQGRILEAQQVLELLKLQELREFTGVRARVTPNGIQLTSAEQAIVTQHNSLIAFGQQVNQCQQTHCSQLTALLDQRDQLTQQFNQTLQTFDAQIRARLSQDRAALDTEHFSTSAHEIVEAPGTVMIYALVLDDKLWLLWATAGGVVNSVEVPVTQQKLGETVLQFRQLLSTPNSDISQVQATAKQLYDWLIDPIASELQKNHIQHLVFSLDRVTRYIPMAALFDGQHYLLENYTVSTVLSAALTHMGDRQPLGTDHTSVLALGLSNAVPPDFGGLPNVPAELNAIVRSANDPQGIYPGLKFLNQQFDDHTLRDNVLGHQIVHIATHGVFVPGRQDQSYLVLGNGNHMSISSIQDLQDLGGVRLVVLSACQTALGEPDQDGIEIAGIAYYFLNGGVNTVMASLWSVNDASTQQLMQHLYHNLSQSTAQAPITRAEALRQAQLSLLQGETNGVGNAGRSIVGVTPRPGTSPATPTNPGLSHPYYWAPFILIGNGL